MAECFHSIRLSGMDRPGGAGGRVYVVSSHDVCLISGYCMYAKDVCLCILTKTIYANLPLPAPAYSCNP